MVHLIFFRNNIFLFVKIESWNFRHLFKLGFHETLQNFSSFRQTFRRDFSTVNKSCPNELKISDFYLTMDSSFFSQKMSPWPPNFLHQRLWIDQSAMLVRMSICKSFIWKGWQRNCKRCLPNTFDLHKHILLCNISSTYFGRISLFWMNLFTTVHYRVSQSKV